MMLSVGKGPSISCRLLTLSEQSTAARHFLFKQTHSFKQSMIFSNFCQLIAWSSRYQRHGVPVFWWLSTIFGLKLPAFHFCDSKFLQVHCLPAFSRDCYSSIDVSICLFPMLGSSSAAKTDVWVTSFHCFFGAAALQPVFHLDFFFFMSII